MQWVRIAKCLFPGQLLKRCDGTFGYTSFPYKCPNIMWASLGHLKLPLVFCRDRKQLVAIMGLLVPTMIQLMMMTESPRIAIHLCLVFYHVDSVKEHERRPYIMFFFNLPGQLGGVIRGCWRMAHGWGLLAKFCFLKPLICMKRILYVQINANIYIYIYTHVHDPCLQIHLFAGKPFSCPWHFLPCPGHVACNGPCTAGVNCWDLACTGTSLGLFTNYSPMVG